MGDIRIVKGASVLPRLAGDMAAWLWRYVNKKLCMHGDSQKRLRDRFLGEDEDDATGILLVGDPSDISARS